MNELIISGLDWHSAAIVGCALIIAVGLLALRRRHRRERIVQASRLTREFRREQTTWAEQHQQLERSVAELHAHVDSGERSLVELREQHREHHELWEENRHHLTERIKQLYELSKRFEREKSGLEGRAQTLQKNWREAKVKWSTELARLQASRDELQQQLEQLPADWEQKLTTALTENDQLKVQLDEKQRWSEQVQQALEDELATLNDRLKHLQRENVDRIKAIK